MKEFPHHQYQVLDKLKQSAGAITFAVKSLSDSENPLILKLYCGARARTNLSALETKLSWQRGLVHPHLLGIASAGISGKGSIFTTRQFSSTRLDLSKATATHITQLLNTVRFLHAHARTHGRIKPSNIFVEDGKVRLADLHLLEGKDPSNLDHIQFSAPEVLLGEVPTFESDYYSLGAILYRIYARRDPFNDSSPENLREKYLQAKIPTIRDLSEIQEPFAKAIEGLLHRNPRRRPSAFAALIRELPFESESVTSVPMIGRSETIDLIQAQVSSTAAKTLTVCLIEGEAGIGKTRLIEELQFKSKFDKYEFFSCACIDRNEPSLAPIIRLLRAVLLHKSRISRVGVRQLLGNFEDNLAPFFEDFTLRPQENGIDHPDERVIQDLIGVMCAFSRKEPLRLCIDDIDKADSGTRNFLKQLCYRASELNVRLLLTCQKSIVVGGPGEIDALLGSAFTRTTLDPLTTGESLELMSYLASRTVNRKRIFARAGGNPFWLLEYSKNQNSQALATTANALIKAETDVAFRQLIFALSASGGSASGDLLGRVVSLDVETVRQKLIPMTAIGAIRESNRNYEIRVEGLGSSLESEIPAHVRRRIHASFYHALWADRAVGEERLADHALYGGLWERTSVHLAALARNSTNQGDNVAALKYFRKLKHVLRKLNQEFSLESECEFAICLARTGKPRSAEQIFERLRSHTDINEDLRIRLALLAKGGEVDRSRLDLRLNFLRQAIESSKYGQEHVSILLSRLCNSCVAAGDLVGAADALRRAQLILRNQSHKKAEVFVKAAEAFLLMNRGSFREALEIYRSLQCETWSMSAAILTNRGICLENLGRIRSAIVFQHRAYQLASKAGHLFARLQCLANLGTFSVKLGNFKEGHRAFEQTKELVSELCRTNGTTAKAIEAEQAWLNVMEGRYDLALRRLRSALTSGRIFKRDGLQLRILECEIHFLLGVEITPADVDQIALEGSWLDSPLHETQLALLRSRTTSSANESMSILNTTLEKAQKASLLYEVCRLELEIADRLRDTDPEAAKPHADEALRIAKKNGYRPLQSRALLLRALCSLHNKEKEHYLNQALKLGSNVGIPEIVSETSYHLGVLYEIIGQPGSSWDCLANSARVIAEIAKQIPVRFRSVYLATSWRNDARKRYEQHLHGKPINLRSIEGTASSRDHPYFRALYRISIAAASARTVDEFLRELLPAMSLSRDSIVVMLTLEGHTSWHSHGVVTSDAVRHRVKAVASKAREQVRFNSNDRWIPFRSVQYSGGICVLGRKRNRMGEEEMEFFTILGIFVSNALDQIHNRVVATPSNIYATEFYGIVGNARPTRDLCAHIGRISNNSATVLIQGETGTGKELVARAIHKLSSRSKAPFIAIDCGAIPEGLLESELFGSKRGAFTGAVADRPGVFEAAHMGTLFLDEISNLNLGMQAKLLRVLQEREVRRVGETRNRPIDVRLIAASNTNLKQQVAEGTFRQDLLFRLNVIGVSIPPLRSRREDIPVLASHFLSQLNFAHKTRKVFGAEAIPTLLAHSFPGNVRELQNSVERGFFTTSGQTISTIPIDASSGDESINEVRKWLADLADGRRNFWTEIHDRYKRRDISREKVVALIDLGLRTTSGSYKNLASLLHIDQREYRRLMDFLRRNNCHLDFRPYRKVASFS